MASGAFASAGLVRQGRGRLLLVIDIGKLLAGAVDHDEGSVDISTDHGGGNQWKAAELPEC
jgi:hypothetical protein